MMNWGVSLMVINYYDEVVENNQFKAIGVKDYVFKERPQATQLKMKRKRNEHCKPKHKKE